MFKKFDLNYEGGKCPYGYEFVNSHKQGNTTIDSYCRKIPKKRFSFSDPDAKVQKRKEQKIQESRETAEKIYWTSRSGKTDSRDAFSDEQL
ncbi:MAG: hypothetical protein B2I17_01710 [Thermoplasmatales archaeon B_DKE]|nr:MAG: hypothetical protein B2I17_01710 [Thermoplasmatales archaeon B_DKE]